MPQQFHIAQVANLPPFFNELQRCGIKTQALVDKTCLRHFNLTDTEAYIPSRGLVELYEELQRKEGIANPVSFFHNSFKIEKFGNIGISLLQLPTFYDVLKTAEDFGPVSKSSIANTLTLKGPLTWFGMNHVDEHPKNDYWHSMISLVQTLDTFKIWFGEDWAPRAIYLKTTNLKELQHLFPKGNYPIHGGAPSNQIVIKTSELSRPSSRPSPYEETNFDDQDLGLLQKIEALLMNLAAGEVMDLKHASELLKVNQRTLQRWIANESNSFLQLQHKTRFLRALRLLEESLSISEIAFSLGYSERVNFIRAFKSWTGMTPGQYRDSVLT